MNRNTSNVDTRASLTAEPLLLQPRPQLHRVNSMQLPPGSGVAVGGCRTDRPVHHPDACTRHGGQCMGDAACPDHQCQGHPYNEAKPEDRDPFALRWFVAGYAAFLVACGWCVANADAIHHWLTH